jgi:hypothetical protein
MSALVLATAQILPDKAATPRREMRQSKFLVPVEGTTGMSSVIRPGSDSGLKLMVNLHLSSILVRGRPL